MEYEEQQVISVRRRRPPARTVAITAATVLAVLAILAYVSGVFTGEERHEESCALCRAVRYTGTHYGFGYEHVEDTVMTTWYRANIDGRHGLDASHPHTWQQSAGTVYALPGGREAEGESLLVAPLFLLRPEVERAALMQIPDKQTQVDLIRALNTPSRRDAMLRVRLLIEYFYIEQANVRWPVWWAKHAPDFGFAPVVSPPVTPLAPASAPLAPPAPRALSAPPSR